MGVARWMSVGRCYVRRWFFCLVECWLLFGELGGFGGGGTLTGLNGCWKSLQMRSGPGLPPQCGRVEPPPPPGMHSCCMPCGALAPPPQYAKYAPAAAAGGAGGRAEAAGPRPAPPLCASYSFGLGHPFQSSSGSCALAGRFIAFWPNHAPSLELDVGG